MNALSDDEQLDSLKSFTKKYKASVVFTHQEGLFQVCLCFINKF